MSDLLENTDRPSNANPVAELRRPTVDDAAAMWRLTRDSRVLDLNSSYAYLLWARDFAATSVVAEVGDQAAGFVSGYRRPDEPSTLMVWQVAVSESHRGQGLARRMLDHLVADQDFDHLETTITEDNGASIALFTSFADAHDAQVERTPVFPADVFPDGHDTELLFRIGPLAR
jgi:diaminobutyrate acetyltransferase